MAEAEIDDRRRAGEVGLRHRRAVLVQQFDRAADRVSVFENAVLRHGLDSAEAAHDQERRYRCQHSRRHRRHRSARYSPPWRFARFSHRLGLALRPCACNAARARTATPLGARAPRVQGKPHVYH